MKLPSSIVIIVTRQIGDVLLATPLIHSFHKAYPDATIDVIAFKGKVGMLKENKDINQIIEIQTHPSISQNWQLLRKIYRRYDLAISMQPGDKPIIYAALASKRRASFIPQITWKNAWKQWLCQYSVSIDHHAHIVLQNAQLAETIGIDRYFRVIVPSASPQELQVLRKLLPFDANNTSYIVLHIFPLRKYKQWPSENWVQLITQLSQRNILVVLTGGPDVDELNEIENIINATNASVVNLAGKLSFAQLAQLLNTAKTYIGPDTSVTHLAAACGTPTIALYGPTNPAQWAPWPSEYDQNVNPYIAQSSVQKVNNVTLLQSAMHSCIPCQQEGCDRHRNSDSRCMQSLSVNAVIQQIID